MNNQYRKEILSLLKENLGKEFKIHELCDSYKLDYDEYFLHGKNNKIPIKTL